MTCINMTEMRWVHYIGPTLDQHTRAILLLDEYYVDPTSGQCLSATYFNMTELRWVHYVGPTLDQSIHVTLVLDKSLLKILR